MKVKIYHIWNIVLTIFFYIFRIFAIDSEKIVFTSYDGKGYGDNCKYIALELKKIVPNAKMFWVLKKREKNDLPNWIHPVRLGSIKYVYEMATAKVWVDNSRKSEYIVKRKGQYYIQTWHGGLGLKLCEGDTLEPLPESWIRRSKHDSSMIDVMISNSRYCTEMYQRAFWYTGKIEEYGSPRCDVLTSISENDKKRVRENLKIDDNTFIVLYAPTFRSTSEDVFDIDVDRVINEIEEREGKKVRFLIRMHPLADLSKYEIGNNKNILDVTSYSDVYELLAVTNMLITDYSSLMMEAMFAKIEVQLYAKDLQSYIKERGFHFQLDELPILLGTSNDEFIRNLRMFDASKYLKHLEGFSDRVGLKESGEASKKVAYLIREQVKEKKHKS